ncbi:hypothetical protein HK102_005787, partial [Quaeritorhiza haematococci]
MNRSPAPSTIQPPQTKKLPIFSSLVLFITLAVVFLGVSTLDVFLRVYKDTQTLFAVGACVLLM